MRRQASGLLPRANEKILGYIQKEHWKLKLWITSQWKQIGVLGEFGVLGEIGVLGEQRSTVMNRDCTLTCGGRWSPISMSGIPKTEDMTASKTWIRSSPRNAWDPISSRSYIQIMWSGINYERLWGTEIWGLNCQSIASEHSWALNIKILHSEPGGGLFTELPRIRLKANLEYLNKERSVNTTAVEPYVLLIVSVTGTRWDGRALIYWGLGPNGQWFWPLLKLCNKQRSWQRYDSISQTGLHLAIVMKMRDVSANLQCSHR